MAHTSAWLDKTHHGDVSKLVPRLIAAGVRAQCVVTSPPYWRLRDYGVDGQIGLEPTIDGYIKRVTRVFALARKILADDGVLWLNMGDSYYTDHVPGGVGNNSTINGTATQEQTRILRDKWTPERGSKLKPKDLIGQAWRLALALQADGWYLRRDVIWHKPNPMPESVNDRPATAHEYVFLLSKSERYYYDADAVKEATAGNAHSRGKGVNQKVSGWADGAVSHSPIRHATTSGGRGKGWRNKQNASFSKAISRDLAGDWRNQRSVWTIPTEPFSGAHFATFPRALVRRCVLAGSRAGDVVFDPFMGTGTVGEVALALGRRYVGTELNQEYIELGRRHRPQALGMPL